MAQAQNLKQLDHMKTSFYFSSESMTGLDLPFRFFHSVIQNKDLMHMESRPQNFSINISCIWFYLRLHVQFFGIVSAVRQRFGCMSPDRHA